MKKFIFCLLGFCINTLTYGQNVGIGTTIVPELLTVNGTALIDAGNLNNGIFTNGKMLKFGTVGGVGIGSNKFAGAGILKNDLEFFTNFQRRFIIDSVGNIGINTPDTWSNFRLMVNGNTYTTALSIGGITPDFTNYSLDVNGSSRFRSNLLVNQNITIDQNLTTYGTSHLIGLLIAHNAISVIGDIFGDSDLRVAGEISTSGRGIVRSSNTTQQTIAYTSGNVSFPNASAGAIFDIQFNIPANQFSANPRVCIANLTNHSGTFERWTYSVVNVDYLNNSFWVRFYNSSTQSSTAAFTLNFVLVGPAL